MRSPQPKTYILALIITIVIFTIAFGISTYLTRQKTEQLKAEEDKIAINILSLETQYDLLTESSCKTFDRQSLRQELDSLQSKLQFMEDQVGESNPEVFRLKRYYSLLEIKDYLLMKKMSDQCKFNTIFVLYFYSNNNCGQCQTQEYLLRAVRDEYPQVEIYSFDYDVDLPAVQTLIALHNIPLQPPVIDINSKPYAQFDSLDSLNAVLAQYIHSTTTPQTATSSIKTIKK